MTDLAALIRRNASRWEAAKLTRSDEFLPVARRLVAQKARLQMMQARTKVPWFVIAVIKQREAGDDKDWRCNICNGQPFNRRTTIVPLNRGPFSSWEDAALDALTNCAPHAARWTDWTAGGALTLLEQYNGLGYSRRGLPSPYVWSGTDQYKSGKYVRDGVFDPNVVDKQLGCAGLIKAMMALDSSIEFAKIVTGRAPTPNDFPPPITADAPKKGAGFWEGFLKMFKRGKA